MKFGGQRKDDSRYRGRRVEGRLCLIRPSSGGAFNVERPQVRSIFALKVCVHSAAINSMSEETEIRTECKCGQHLSGPKTGPVSHGVCPECKARFLASLLCIDKGLIERTKKNADS